MRLSAKDAAARAAQMKQDWDDEKYPSYSALSRAYEVSVVYARNCIIGAKCAKVEPPKGKRKAFSMFGVEYLVYRDGRVWSISVNKMLACKNGMITFKEHGTDRRFKTSVARIVLSKFDREPLPGEQARHKDDNRANNHIDNLVWGTNQDNVDDKARNGNQIRGEAMFTAKITAAEVIAFVNGYDGSVTKKEYCSDYAEISGHNPKHLYRVLQKSSWAHLWDGRKVVDPKIVKYIRKKAQDTDMPLTKFYRRCAAFLVDKGYQVNATTIEKIVQRKTWASV